MTKAELRHWTILAAGLLCGALSAMAAHAGLAVAHVGPLMA